MLDALTPAEFDAWVAWSRLQPDAETRIAEILKLGFTAVCAAWGLTIDPELLDPGGPQNVARHQPGPTQPTGEEDVQEVTPDQAAAWARIMIPGTASRG